MAFLFYVLIGLSVNLLIGFVAYLKKSLSFPSGFTAAGLVGITIFLASWKAWTVLMFFFVSSSALSKFKKTDPIKSEAMAFAEKGDERDALQVFANGGTAFIFSLIVLFMSGVNFGSSMTPPLMAILASLAASTADTWSTEIGTSSRSLPVLIYRPTVHVPRGTSGGITALGTFASLLGALLVGVVSSLLFSSYALLLPIAVSGFIGGVIDSLLGGLVQASYRCVVCHKATEKRMHCNSPTEYVKGISWIDNDAVNFISSFLAGLLAYFLVYYPLMPY